MSDLRPSLDPPFEVFGLPATLTVPGGTPITTTGVWVTLQTALMPAGLDARVAEARKVLALRGDELPAVPRGTLVEISERAGEPVRSWRVDGFDRVDEEDLRVLVIPVD